MDAKRATDRGKDPDPNFNRPARKWFRVKELRSFRQPVLSLNQPQFSDKQPPESCDKRGDDIIFNLTYD